MARLTCGNCGRPFTGNPALVPSVRYPEEDTAPLRLCLPCVIDANLWLKAYGHSQFTVPPGAYRPDDADS